MPKAIEKQQEIDQNYEAFLEILPSLMKTQAGKFVIMRHKKTVEFFDTARDAMIYASNEYKDDLFSVQEVTDKVVDLGWISYAPIQANL
ncbi:MAG: hypothetical protein ACT4OY_06090 [Alphaproteobacteria bacterium]